MINPILWRLQVYVMVPSLTRQGVRHNRNFPGHQRVKQIAEMFLLDMLNHFLAVD